MVAKSLAMKFETSRCGLSGPGLLLIHNLNRLRFGVQPGQTWDRVPHSEMSPPLREVLRVTNAQRDILRRVPRRLSISVSDDLFRRLQLLADQQGRSTSNLCAFLLEKVVQAPGKAEL